MLAEGGPGLHGPRQYVLFLLPGDPQAACGLRESQLDLEYEAVLAANSVNDDEDAAPQPNGA